MSPLFITYLLYLAISVGLTIWVAQTLSKNGLPFLVDVFSGNEAIANSINHLLVVGFYLINLGYVCLALKVGAVVVDATGSVEVLSQKIGVVMLVLGGMHFFNLWLFSKIRGRAIMRDAPPPVRPDDFVAMEKA